MKIKILLFLLFLSVFAFPISAQNVIIKPKKTVYTRKGKVVDKEKRTFIVTYPVVSGTISPAAKKSLENTISYWKNFEMTLQENLAPDNVWLSELGYSVNYNKKAILDISLTEDGVGAYPSSSTVNLVIDLKSGKAVTFTNAFRTDKLNELAAMVNKQLQTEKAGIIKDINDDKQNTEEDRQSNIEMVSALEFKPENFKEFRVDDKGATILYNADFPHVVQSLQPVGEYFFTWTELKPFIKSGSLLGKFIS